MFYISILFGTTIVKFAQAVLITSAYCLFYDHYWTFHFYNHLLLFDLSSHELYDYVQRQPDYVIRRVEGTGVNYTFSHINHHYTYNIYYNANTTLKFLLSLWITYRELYAYWPILLNGQTVYHLQENGEIFQEIVYNFRELGLYKTTRQYAHPNPTYSNDRGVYYRICFQGRYEELNDKILKPEKPMPEWVRDRERRYFRRL